METEQGPWRARLRAAAAHAVPGDGAHRLLLWCLLAAAAALRLWNLPHLPFTHDEISALVRIYPSLGETVRTGVAALDTHPAGVQVFEWFWTRLFGTGEAAVKLPFILMSVAALFFLYRFAAAWTSPAAALLSIAFIGCIQYTVMYGQIARPYAFGFFTCALLMDAITRMLGGRKRAWVTAGLMLAASAYAHHFALLFAALAWLCTLPLAERGQRKSLLIAGGAAVLLYLPHVPITLHQYGEKGLDEWLLPPDASWLPAYITWIFQYGKALAAVVLGTGLAGWVLVFRKPLGPLNPVLPLCLALGVLPLAIGYAYSVWRAPVLQYSVLLFSFPFLVFPLFAGWKSMRRGILAVLVTAIAATAIFGLVADRRHYAIFYRSKYEAAARGIIDAAGRPGRVAIVDLPAEVPGFYFRQWGVDSTQAPFLNLRGRSPFAVDSLLRGLAGTSAFFAQSTGGAPENTARVQARFPFLLERHDMEEGQTFLFSAMPGPGRTDDRTWSSTIAPAAVAGEGWTVDPALKHWRDSTRLHAPEAWDLTGREFGITLHKPIYQVAPDDNAVIEAHLDAAGAQGTGLKLVVELLEGGQAVSYRSQPISRGADPRTATTALLLADIPGHGHGGQLHAYVWNEGGHMAHIGSLTVRVREGNPWLHGLFQPLVRPLKYP